MFWVKVLPCSSGYLELACYVPHSWSWTCGNPSASDSGMYYYTQVLFIFYCCPFRLFQPRCGDTQPCLSTPEVEPGGSSRVWDYTILHSTALFSKINNVFGYLESLKTVWAMYDLVAKCHSRTKTTDCSRAQAVISTPSSGSLGHRQAPLYHLLEFSMSYWNFKKMSMSPMIYLLVLIQTNAFNSNCAWMPVFLN